MRSEVRCCTVVVSLDLLSLSLESFRMFLATFSNIIGAIVLITVVIPWFLLGAFAIGCLYAYAAAFYRSSARELKVFFSVRIKFITRLPSVPAATRRHLEIVVVFAFL